MRSSSSTRNEERRTARNEERLRRTARNEERRTAGPQRGGDLGPRGRKMPGAPRETPRPPTPPAPDKSLTPRPPSPQRNPSPPRSASSPGSQDAGRPPPSSGHLRARDAELRARGPGGGAPRGARRSDPSASRSPRPPRLSAHIDGSGLKTGNTVGSYMRLNTEGGSRGPRGGSERGRGGAQRDREPRGRGGGP